MIALLSGRIAHKGISHIVVDTQGVGYRVFIPVTTFYELPEEGQAVTLHIHTHVKEDAIHLFGFYTGEERDLFQMLISVSGIGPKIALSILSGISVDDLLRAISGGDVAKLVCTPGVGKKMAERLILELREKVIKKMSQDNVSAVDPGRNLREMVHEDVLSALVNLGYKPGTAKAAIDKVASQSETEPAMDELLKQTLRILAG
ncbi:MAG: Holliday junction branch migration protein RuvA [Smithellaceae bacterium]